MLCEYCTKYCANIVYIFWKYRNTYLGMYIIGCIPSQKVGSREMEPPANPTPYLCHASAIAQPVFTWIVVNEFLNSVLLIILHFTKLPYVRNRCFIPFYIPEFSSVTHKTNFMKIGWKLIKLRVVYCSETWYFTENQWKSKNCYICPFHNFFHVLNFQIK